jgi:hypothetical protein
MTAYVKIEKKSAIVPSWLGADAHNHQLSQ